LIKLEARDEEKAKQIERLLSKLDSIESKIDKLNERLSK